MKKMISILLSCIVFALVISGCHTMQGLGEDISSGGKALSRAAKRDDNGKKNNKASVNENKTTKKKSGS